MESNLITIDLGYLPVKFIDCIILDYCAKVNEVMRQDFQNGRLRTSVNPLFHECNINTGKIIKVNFFFTTPEMNKKHLVKKKV